MASLTLFVALLLTSSTNARTAAQYLIRFNDMTTTKISRSTPSEGRLLNLRFFKGYEVSKIRKGKKCRVKCREDRGVCVGGGRVRGGDCRKGGGKVCR